MSREDIFPHIRHRREEIKFKKKYPWHNRFRKLFTRYENKDENYLGLVQLANSIIVYRRIILG
ncbi:MAG TPA: hypothetical protein VFV86_06530 [Nitrososphaeraceae archaeon]|nr:hypothetical protein [Nitrososphaeraceae archaeon]